MREDNVYVASNKDWTEGIALLCIGGKWHLLRWKFPQPSKTDMDIESLEVLASMAKWLWENSVMFIIHTVVNRDEFQAFKATILP